MKIIEVETLHERIFETLRANRLCRSKSDFSRQFCGRSRAYLNTLGYNGHQPSPEALSHIRRRLRELSDGQLKAATKRLLHEFVEEIDQQLYGADTPTGD